MFWVLKARWDIKKWRKPEPSAIRQRLTNRLNSFRQLKQVLAIKDRLYIREWLLVKYGTAIIPNSDVPVIKHGKDGKPQIQASS